MQPTQNNPIDFTPLENYKKTMSNVTAFMMFGSIYFVVILVITPLFLSGSRGWLHIMAWLSVICALVIGGVIGYIVLKKSREKQHAAVAAFARKNGFIVLDQIATDPLPGTLFRVGHGKKGTGFVAGTLNDLEFRLFEYQYETGNGKNRTVFNTMVIEFTLPRVVPHFVIDSHLESVIPVNFDSSQRIELEGDFHKYFDLYAPDQYGVSALTILAPDAMLAIMENAALCDLEIVQDKIYFYWPEPIQNRQQCEQLFVTAQAVLQKIGKKLTTDDIYANEDHAQVHVSPTAEGARLKRARPWRFAFAYGVCFVAYGVFRLFSDTSSTSVLLYGVFWVAVFGLALWKIVSVQRLKQTYFKQYKRDS